MYILIEVKIFARKISVLIDKELNFDTPQRVLQAYLNSLEYFWKVTVNGPRRIIKAF